MLTGAGLSRVWAHHRAHLFFSHARWSSEDLGLALARLVVALLVPVGAAVLIAVDDTLFKRTGKKVQAIGWFHDGSAKGPKQVGLGNNWVIAAVIVRLPFCSRPVALPVLARLVHKDITPASASRLILATTNHAASPAEVIERYAARWSIKVAIEDAKQIFGAGQARNRLAAAVHRTLPFTLACQSLAVLWYATAGHHPADVDGHRARAPWYRTKAEPSTADMIAKLRRVLIAAKYRPVHPASRPRKNSTPSGWPGKAPWHNRESRDIKQGTQNGCHDVTRTAAAWTIIRNSRHLRPLPTIDVW
jgi:hypothetical protein